MADIKIVDLDQGTALGANDSVVLVQGNETLKISGQDVAWGVKTLANLADKAYVDAIVAGAPELLDTLNELAAAIGDDPNFGSSIRTLLDSKLPTANFGFEFWKAIDDVTTYHITEDSNLYFTEQRVLDVVTPLIPAPYSLPTASTSVLGGVKVDGNTIVIDSNGKITAVGGGGVIGNDPTFNSVTTSQLNVRNVAFTGTGAVNITSGNDLNLTAAGEIFFNGERTISLARLKTVVAASTDFADFKARIAAL